MEVTSGAERQTLWWRLPPDDVARLSAAAHELSQLRSLEGVMAVVRKRARDLMHADGVTFVLREGEQVYYADEDAIGPLWKGRRFPARECISGWAIAHKETVVIPDIYADSRVPVEAYRPTFVKSLLMVPIRTEDPIGAIGSYWATHHEADDRERLLLEALAGFTAVAVANAQLYQEARDAVRAREDWIGIASHELRTPLTPMKLGFQGLRRALTRGVPPAELASRIDRAERNVDRLSVLVEQLLDYSRFAAGTLVLKPEAFDLAPLLLEVCERFRSDALGKAIPIDVRAPAQMLGSWDRVRVEELLTTLVSNAIKYGAGQPIEVELDRHQDAARVVVIDHGPGVRPQDQERIFQPFTRFEGTHQGVGLGLWLARKVAQAHGGTIEVTSDQGAGMRVTATLPSAP
ncbi:MAG TPA: GAF domain-containing sensor histidine kinase [Polyangia bacterium]|nr:GAF domain-containing sensor histidine kinase [Polyangia bacterium]